MQKNSPENSIPLQRNPKIEMIHSVMTSMTMFPPNQKENHLRLHL